MYTKLKASHEKHTSGSAYLMSHLLTCKQALGINQLRLDLEGQVLMSSNQGYNVNSFALIIGRGKISFHIKSLFSFLNLKFLKYKDDFADFSDLDSKNIEFVFLAVPDHQILENFRKLRELFRPGTKFIHLSGSNYFKQITGIHPLDSFTKSTLETKTDVPLYTDSLSFFNKYKDSCDRLYYIDADKKALYHSMAVLVGNFTQYHLEWVKNNFPKDLDFYNFRQLALSSVESVFNEENRTMDHLTGPLIRKDFDTIENNLRALSKFNTELHDFTEKMNLFYAEELSNEN